MASGASANVDTAKFLTLENPKWRCSDFALKMLEDGVHADITFNAEGGSVKAHKSVLTCVSPVFSAMFQHDMKEQFTSIVDIPDMSIEALQLFLLLLYTTNKVGDEDVVANMHKTVHENQMPHLNAAIDKHFSEFYKATLKYQVENRLGCVLISALARNLTPENCWYYYDSSMMATPMPFKPIAYSVCYDYILGNYHNVIKSKCFLEAMRRNPGGVWLVIKNTESQTARKMALENYL